VPAGVSGWVIRAHSLWGQERAVHDFRCYIVDSSSHILARVEITAADLEAAKRDAFEVLRTKRQQSSLPAHGVEIWRGTSRLFSGEAEAALSC
jgi:hypothetical protein